ncbi:DEKNAAC105331 [Brettanomyces naardenensis]|uniref:DEKNAAC105331 n=1 Tax=Brettanomyces naardenensis TaxID=13370 RepID=A0A448YT68_BRENA|nr:DEKNAAC105331 [Brettanomyces naardenensis]
MSYHRGPVCGVDNCPSTLWRTIDGRTVCQYGHVNEFGIELNDEDENMGSIGSGVFTKRLNDVSGLTQKHARHRRLQKIQQNGQSDYLYGEQLNLMLIRSMQVILTKQANCLARIYNLDTAMFLKVVKRYWCLLLAHSYNGKSSGGGKLSITFTHLLMVCYLSLIKVRAPVYMSDLLNLASLERIPCLKAENSLPPSISRRIPLTSLALLRGNILQKRSFYDLKGVKQIVDINEEFKGFSLNYLPLLVRLVLEMFLPLEIAVLVKNLIDSFSIDLSFDHKLHPEMRLMGLLIVSAESYFHSNPRIYPIWCSIYLEHRFDKSCFNVDLDPSKVLAELQQHSTTEEMLDWDSHKITDMAKLYYRYYLPSIKSDNIANHKQRYTSRKMIAQRLNSIFPIDELGENDTAQALENYKNHLIEVYAKLYEEEGTVHPLNSDRYPSLKLVDLLVDHLRMDSGLNYQDFKEVIKYGESLAEPVSN